MEMLQLLFAVTAPFLLYDWHMYFAITPNRLVITAVFVCLSHSHCRCIIRTSQHWKILFILRSSYLQFALFCTRQVHLVALTGSKTPLIVVSRKMNSAVDGDTRHEHDPSESVDSDDASSDEDSGTGTSTSNNFSDQRDSKIDHVFIQREEMRVRKARYILAIMTLVFAVTVTVAVYFSARNGEYQNFEDEVRLVFTAKGMRLVVLSLM
jgi:hypothetical protein